MKLNELCACRICPGRYFADAGLWLAVSNVLSVFNIGPALDEKGVPEVPHVEFTNGMTRCVHHVQPFPPLDESRAVADTNPILLFM